MKSKNPKKIAIASERPITIKVNRRVSGSVGQLMCRNSCRASDKKALMRLNMLIYLRIYANYGASNITMDQNINQLV